MSKAPSKPSSAFVSKLASFLPAWIVASLVSKRSWKTLARCWLASWAVFLLLLPNKSLSALGNAAFFGLIASMLVPPSMPIQLFIFSVATLATGMGLGWAIGAAAMKAALAARSQTLLRSALERAHEGAAGVANPDAVFELDVFQGMFLDWRSSLVYGVFLSVGVSVFALIRAYVPKLMVMSIFGTIVLDVFCSFGPLFPAAEFTIVSSFFISVGCYVAIAIFCITFIFPETMNHSYLDTITRLLGGVKVFSELQGQILNYTPDEIANDKDGVLSKSASFRYNILMGLQALPLKTGLIDAEFSWGRWNGADCKDLEKPIRLLIARISGFHLFSNLVVKYASSPTLSSGASSSATTLPARSAEPNAGDAELIRELVSERYTTEVERNVQLENIIPVLRESTAALRSACIDALGAGISMIDYVNQHRWTRASVSLSQEEEKLDLAIENIRRESEAFKNVHRNAINEPFIAILQSKGQLSSTIPTRLPIRSLIIISVFASHLIVAADCIVDLLETLRTTSKKRQRNRLWAPKGLRALGKWVVRRDKEEFTEGVLGEGVRPDTNLDDEEQDVKHIYKLDPDSRAPTNVIQKVMDALHRTYKWCKTPEAIYVWKYVIVTIALWIPSVIKHSANFYYVQKGVWALIMAQITVNIYIADQIYDYVARIIGTFVGLVVGLLAWYIGNGSGNGNPYGMAASFGVILIPLVFLRINSPPQFLVPISMMNATVALVIGFSWQDGHIVTIGSPGIGWSVAWKRWVLVVIGCVASFILIIIPPTSGRKAVRLRNAAIINDLSSLYSVLMTAWISKEGEDQEQIAEKNIAPESVTEDNEKKASITDKIPRRERKWVQSFREKILPLAQQMQGLKRQTLTAKWEGNLRGAWPIEEYITLVEKEFDMLAALTQTFGALTHLDPSWRLSLNHQTLILNPDFITDVMTTFSLVSQSLRTSEPMHQILSTSLLDRLLHHHSHNVFSNADKVPSTVDYIKRIQSPEFMFFATGVAAVSQIISCLDELHKTTKRLCGEVPFEGFSVWKNEYENIYAPKSQD